MRPGVAIVAIALLFVLVWPLGLHAAGPIATSYAITAEQPNQPHAEPALAADPSNPSHLVGADIEGTVQPSASGCTVYDSSDAGEHWTGAPLPLTSEFGSDPSVAIARDGTVYASCLAVGYTSPTTTRSIGAYVSRSGDGGRTFTETALAAASTPSLEIDKPYLAIDNGADSYSGRLYLCYSGYVTNGGPSIYLAYSTDRGVTWQTQPVSTDIGHECSLAIGPDGTVYVGYVQYQGTTPVQEVVTHSTDGGQTFGQPIAVGPISPLPGIYDYYGALAVDQSSPHKGSIYITYESGVSGTGRTVVFSRSTDGGNAWSSPLRVADSAPSVETFMPWVQVAPDGRIDVAFADRRNAGSGAFDIYLASSSDGGVNFSADTRLSPAPAPWATQRGTPQWPGDYLGLVSTDSQADVLWAAAVPPATTTQLYFSVVPFGTNATATSTPVPPTATASPTATSTPTATPTKVDPATCKRGYHRVHKRCVKVSKKRLHCKRGYHVVRHHCVKIHKKRLRCKKGYHVVRHRCVKWRKKRA